MLVKMFQSTISYVYKKLVHNFKDVNDWSEEESIQGKVVVITGANCGLGKVVTAQFAKRNAIVIMGCRDLVKGAKAATDIQNGNPNANLDLIRLDLGDLASIQDFSSKVHTKYTSINILINNAAAQMVQGVDEEVTKDGYEIHVGTNYIGHFLLTNLLMDLIQRGAPSRIVTISCFTHEWAQLKFDDLMMEKRGEGDVEQPTDLLKHANSKLSLILFSRELSNRLKSMGVHTYSLCPGLMKPSTGMLQLSNPRFKQILAQSSRMMIGNSFEQGCETVLYCAISTCCSHETGKLYRFGKWWNDADDKLKDHDTNKLWLETKRLIPTKYWRRPK